MTKKKEPKYIGRYGEILKDVEEDRRLINDEWVAWHPNPELLPLKGWGIDENGVKREVRFSVSRKTGKKCGEYLIYRPKEEVKRHHSSFNSNLLKCYPTLEESIDPGCYPLIIERCDYQNDLPHGNDVFYNASGEITKIICFLRGRELKGEDSQGETWLNHVQLVGEKERTERKNAAEKSLNLRKLFSNASVLKAIKTGDVVKVKSAMTRALKKKEMGE